MANHRVLLAVLATSVCFFLHVRPAYAADPVIPGNSVALPNPFTQGSLPPTFSTGAAAQLAAKFSACVNSSTALGILGSLGSTGRRRGVTGGARLEDACASTDGKPIGDDLGELNDLTKCELLQTDGKYDPAKLTQEKERIDQMTAHLQCRENKFKQVKTQLDCLTVQANQISQQISSLGQVFTQSIQKMQQDVGDLVSQSKNRGAQIEDINMKLTGDPKGAGTTGLLQAQQITRALVSKMLANVQALKEEQKKASLQRSSLVERAQQRTMGLTKDCFTTQTKAEFRCYTSGTANNPAQSAKDYLLCRYRQNQTQVGNGGVVTQNGIQAAVGNKKADELGSLLDEIFSESPDANQTTTDPQKFQQQIDKVVTVLSVADVERVFGKRLKAFDGKGIPVHDYVMKYLGSCFQKATISVQNERSRTNSSLGQAEEAIKALERQNSLVVRSYMNDIATQFGENMKALTGDHLPLDVSQCNNAQPDIQANCLDEAMLNLQAQLSGVKPAAAPNTTDYSMNIFIKGNDAKTDITVACVGLDGCVTKLQQYSTALGREQQKIDAFKTDYVGKAFRNTEQFTQQLRQQLSPQSEALRNQLKTLNAALATLGVEDLIKIEDVNGEELEKDGEEPNQGLPKIPRDILALIGSKMSPPLLNVAGNNFSGALGSISKAANELKNKEAKLAQYKVRLGPLAENCKKKDLEDPIKEIIADANAYKACTHQLCEREGSPGGSYSDLASTLRGTGLPGLSGLADASGILSSGSSECTRLNVAFQDRLSELRRKWDEAKAEVTTKERLRDLSQPRAPASGGTPDSNAQLVYQQAEAAVTAAKTAASNAETEYNRVRRQGGSAGTGETGGDNRNCDKIATDIQYKYEKVRNRANTIYTDSAGAR